MSLVVAYQQDGKVYMASDSQATSDDSHIRYTGRAKMYKKHGFLIGFCGSVRQSQVAMKVPLKECSSVIDWVEAARLVLKEAGCVGTYKEEGEGEFEIMQSMFLVAHDGDLYEIGPDFAILDRVEPYGAIGEGRSYALAVLYAIEKLKPKLSPKKKIELAMEAGTRFCSTVGGKIYYEVL
jgi:ATP-dependent protease HslVU (ClpYQ) peptidase subunit